MRLPFTKMQGAGNDFVVLDATRAPIVLSEAQVRALGDRRYGVGADQILVVERSDTPGVDFRYRIYNNSGDEVEQCGNGARCFVRFVRDKGLTTKDTIRVETVNSLLELSLQADGRVTVDMGAPVFDHARIPFDAAGLRPERRGDFEQWPLDLGDYAVEVAVLSMGNPHAVQIVGDIDGAAVALQGPAIEAHPRFPNHVNAGFMQIVDRGHVRLRVHERDAGETLACGTGACAAVVAGIRLGLLDAQVDVQARGGRLSIEWQGGDALEETPGRSQVSSTPSGGLTRSGRFGGALEETPGRSQVSSTPSGGLTRSGRFGGAHVFMTGPAETVFEGVIEL